MYKKGFYFFHLITPPPPAMTGAPGAPYRQMFSNETTTFTKHRYIFGLYKQDREIFSEPLNERQIEIDNLKNKLNLYEKPIFETKFISQNESGGRKRRKTRRRKNKKLKITRRR